MHGLHTFPRSERLQYGHQFRHVYERGRKIEGRLIVPMFHPAAALHQPSLRKDVEADFRKLPEILAQFEKLEDSAPPPPEAEPPPVPPDLPFEIYDAGGGKVAAGTTLDTTSADLSPGTYRVTVHDGAKTITLDDVKPEASETVELRYSPRDGTLKRSL